MYSFNCVEEILNQNDINFDNVNVDDTADSLYYHIVYLNSGIKKTLTIKANNINSLGESNAYRKCNEKCAMIEEDRISEINEKVNRELDFSKCCSRSGKFNSCNWNSKRC